MGLQDTLKKVVEALMGVRIYRALPHGLSIDYDIARRYPNYHFNIMFDVGANIGQSASKYASKYPSSTIYCFEPCCGIL